MERAFLHQGRENQTLVQQVTKSKMTYLWLSFYRSPKLYLRLYLEPLNLKVYFTIILILNILILNVLNIKEAERQRIDAFELWYWRRLLRIPGTARRSNQSILKEISPEYSLEGLMLKLKLQCFGHLMWRTDSLERPWCWERLKARGEGDDRGWDGWMASPTQWTWVNSRSGWWTGRPRVLQSMGSQRVRHDWAAEQNWTDAPLWSMKTVLRKELKAVAFFSVGSRFAFWLLSFHEVVGLVNIVLILSILLLWLQSW